VSSTVSNLGRFDPDTINTQSVFHITPSGNIKVVATGLSKVLGIAFDRRARVRAGNFVLHERPRSRTRDGSLDPHPAKRQAKKY
jgi:hypothetical protein